MNDRTSPLYKPLPTITPLSLIAWRFEQLRPPAARFAEQRQQVVHLSILVDEGVLLKVSGAVVTEHSADDHSRFVDVLGPAFAPAERAEILPGSVAVEDGRMRAAGIRILISDDRVGIIDRHAIRWRLALAAKCR